MNSTSLDTERFPIPPPSHFVCEICHCVVANAIEHNSCETAFCGSCIKRWMESNSSCPHCRDRCSMSSFRPLHRVLRQQLESLAVRCENHPDCVEPLTVGTLEKHLAEDCRFCRRKCDVPGCDAEFLSSELAKHMHEAAEKHVELLQAALLQRPQSASTFDCMAPVNSAGATMKLGSSPGCRAKLYCGRRLGRQAIPGSDGRCGPNDGPQCEACRETKILNARGHEVRPGGDIHDPSGEDKLYCGESYDIPGTDGRCGPNNGPQCKFCEFLQTNLPKESRRSYADDLDLLMNRRLRAALEGEMLQDIGTFAEHLETPGRNLLSAGAQEESEDVAALLSSIPASNLAADFAWMAGPVLPPRARSTLIEHLDRAAAEQTNGEELEDLKMTLDEGELRAMIGDAAVDDVKAVPGFPSDFTSIRLRRCEAAGKCINFHLDASLRTMQVALNGDSEYTGGALAFANREGLHCPQRPAGSATIHSADIVHGVTELVQGTRYSLFFLTEAVPS